MSLTVHLKLFMIHTLVLDNVFPISVWAKPSKSGSDIYRLGSAELLTEGYRRGTRDDDAVVVILNRGPPRACSNSCASKLIVNERINDGVILHQINTSVPPPGYKSVDGASSLYCVLNEGDCGADAPLFIFRKRSPINTAYAYSVDPNVSIAGFEKEAKPLCYGWSDRGKRADGVLSNVLKQLDGCGPISGVVNGQVTNSFFSSAVNITQVIYESASNVNFPVGSTATVHCRNGFTVVGPTSLTCTHFGWYPESVLGNCAVENDAPISHCESFPTPQNGQIIYNSQRSGVHPSGTIAILQCDIGFRATSTTLEAKCENGLWSTPNLGPCEQSTSRCSQLPSVLNGQIEYITDKNGQLGVGATAKLRCIAGYQIAGSNFVTCTTSGWIPFTGIGTCHLSNVQCVTGMPVVLNGQISYSQGGLFGPFPSGTLATLTCNAGFIVSGQSTASCSGQSWQPSSFGTCSRDPGDGSGAHCPFGLGPPIGGTISYSKVRSRQASSATLEIFRRANGIGKNLMLCSDQVEQNNQRPFYWRHFRNERMQLLLSAEEMNALMITFRGGLQGHRSVLFLLELQRHYSAQADPHRVQRHLNVLTASGVRTLSEPVQRLQELAVEMQCSSAISTPANGQVTYSEGRSIAPFPSGTMAMLTCSLGNQPSGEITSRCDNGQWRPSTFSPCTRSASGAAQCVFGIGPPVNGRVHYSNGALLGPFPSGTSAGVVCNSGFAPTGTTPSVCQNGQWSSTALGQCTRGGGSGVTQCPTGPGTVFNGQINYSNGAIFGPFPSGVTATLSCNSGFSPSGGLTTSTCQNGIWSPSSLAQCVVGGSGSDGAQCFSGLATPPNGQISYSNGMQFGPFPSNTAATLTCLFGFSPSGQTTSICTNGVWNPPTMSQCIQGIGSPGQCFALMPPFNGQISYSQQSSSSTYPTGTIATLMCGLGFTVSGGATATTCINGQWNPSTLGTCQAGIGGSGSGASTTGQCLFALPSVSNGNIQYSSGSSIGPFNSGTSASLTCNSGSTLMGPMTSFCSYGVWQPSSLGPCSSTNGVTDVGSGVSGRQCYILPAVLEGEVSFAVRTKLSCWK
ncbi:unnamed protein product [Toxocara canis]|uniref:Sushi, von Willebrand factor type A, EGF and pentraxin domain-containing protein 1 n=1 Tax=Toxocara canis TaxID=6265 RepID=A0A183UKW3_TOXCA|nr:unnamed protein product [Toxocara canis]